MKKGILMFGALMIISNYAVITAFDDNPFEASSSQKRARPASLWGDILTEKQMNVAKAASWRTAAGWSRAVALHPGTTNHMALAPAIMDLRDRIVRLEQIAQIHHGSGRPEDEMPSTELVNLPQVGSSAEFEAAAQSNIPLADSQRRRNVKSSVLARKELARQELSDANPFADTDPFENANPFAPEAEMNVSQRRERMQARRMMQSQAREDRRAEQDAKRAEKWSAFHARAEARKATANQR